MDAPSVTAAIGSDRPVSIKEVFGLVDASLDWDDLASLVAGCELPVVVKGLMHPADAELAIEAGAAGVVVSNHGGRQLDGVPATIDALPAVAEAVDGRAPVLVDGGIRRGTDVLVALALGADAVLAGRPAVWGLAVDGEEGAREVLEILKAEIRLALALLGAGRPPTSLARTFSARVIPEAGNRRQERKSPVASGSMWGRRKGRRAQATVATLAVSATWLLTASASAQVLVPGVDPGPIPDPLGAGLPQFEGEAVEADPFSFPPTPQHPHMAPNGRSNIHVDPYQTDTNTIRGPLGPTTTDSIFFLHECASITFDSEGRLVTICVGVERPILALLDPDTLTPLATYDLPLRIPGAGSNPFTDFSGGGYFYLDDEDRAIMPTTDRHIYVIAQTDEPGFERVEDYDLNGPVTSDDKVISALPDWRGRIWFATVEGVVGWVNPRSGAVHSKDLGEPIGNSFAVDEKGSVYMVTDAALYRLRARKGKVREQWREEYPNTGLVKPGQTQAGSGTTPTLLAGGKLVAITDNADPINVLAFQRKARPNGKRLVCKEPVFEKGRRRQTRA